MTPYYEHGGITIYHGDCRDVIEQWEGLRTQSFDILLTDPPYGILADAGSAATRRSGGNVDSGVMTWDIAPTSEMLSRLRNICCFSMIWGGLHLSLPPTYGYLVWDKQIDGLNFGEAEVCWTSLEFRPLIFRYRAVGVDGGKIHPTQKPVALMTFCLSLLRGLDGVLDPYMGSGTTLVAAKQQQMRAVGIEISERYCEIAAKRLSQEVLPLEPLVPDVQQGSLL